MEIDPAATVLQEEDDIQVIEEICHPSTSASLRNNGQNQVRNKLFNSNVIRGVPDDSIVRDPSKKSKSKIGSSEETISQQAKEGSTSSQPAFESLEEEEKVDTLNNLLSRVKEDLNEKKVLYSRATKVNAELWEALNKKESQLETCREMMEKQPSIVTGSSSAVCNVNDEKWFRLLNESLTEKFATLSECAVSCELFSIKNNEDILDLKVSVSKLQTNHENLAQNFETLAPKFAPNNTATTEAIGEIKGTLEKVNNRGECLENRLTYFDQELMAFKDSIDTEQFKTKFAKLGNDIKTATENIHEFRQDLEGCKLTLSRMEKHMLEIKIAIQGISNANITNDVGSKKRTCEFEADKQTTENEENQLIQQRSPRKIAKYDTAAGTHHQENPVQPFDTTKTINGRNLRHRKSK